MKTYELFLLCLIIAFALCEGSDNSEDQDIKNGNETEPDPFADHPMDVNVNEPPKVAFVGFSDFDFKPEKIDNFFIATLVAWLKRLDGPRRYGTMTMTVTIIQNRRLRNLKEEETKAECIPLRDDTDTIPYDCTIKSSIEIDSLEADPSSIKIEGVDTDNIKISPLAEEQMNNLQEQTKPALEKFNKGDLHYGILYDSILTEDDNNFILKGTLDDTDFPSGELLLTLPKKDSEDNVNVTCNLTPSKEEKESILKCEYPKNSVSTELEGKVATEKTGDSRLTIGMKDPNKKLERDNGGINNYSRQKSSDGGLSGGAIAGIVIACAVALIAAAITAVVCRAPAKPPLQEESTLGVNTNNVIVN